MKFMFLIAVVFLYKYSNSQTNVLATNCLTCDTLAQRECGKREYKETSIKKRKIRKDIKLLSDAQKFLSNNEIVFMISNDKSSNLFIQKSGDTLLRQETIFANYFCINTFLIKIENSFYKGLQINKSSTVLCGIDDTYFFDTRLIKHIIPKLVFPYIFNSCSQILVNYSNDFWADKFKIKSPTKIPDGGHFAPYMLADEYLKKILNN
jgi:hypothetical protein